MAEQHYRPIDTDLWQALSTQNRQGNLGALPPPWALSHGLESGVHIRLLLEFHMGLLVLGDKSNSFVYSCTTNLQG